MEGRFGLTRALNPHSISLVLPLQRSHSSEDAPRNLIPPAIAQTTSSSFSGLTHDSPLPVLENNGNGILLGSNSNGISSTSSSTYYYSLSSPTSSTSCSSTISEFKEVVGCPPDATERGRAPHTKCSCPSAFPYSTNVPPLSSDANTADGTTLAALNNLDADHNHNVNKKKLKIKLTPSTTASYTGTTNGTSTTEGGGGGGEGGGEVRKCLHCGIQKTSWWMRQKHRDKVLLMV